VHIAIFIAHQKPAYFYSNCNKPCKYPNSFSVSVQGYII